MVAHGSVWWVRRGLKLYVLTDLVLGPILVGAGFLAFAVLIFGIAAAWHLGLPWPIAMTMVGLAWAAIFLGTRRATRWVLRLMRPTKTRMA